AAVDGYGVATNAWDVQGYWHDDQDESEHWHITSKEVGGAGFPGLDRLLEDPEHQPGRAFGYVASLHGMRYTKEGLLLGGRAAKEAKCLIASRVRERMEAESLPVPAVFIWDHDKDLPVIDLPHSDGPLFTITAERGSDPGLSGLDEDNIVNRLSPNAGGEVGFGGIQIEQSPDLRDDTLLVQFHPEEVTYRDLVAEEIGHAFGLLASRPGLIADGSTAICDALEAGDPAPLAEIRGRVWWDENDNATEGPSEPGVSNMELELLDDTPVVIATTRTDAQGAYAFTGLGPGSYQVRVAASAVFDLATQGGPGDDDTVDSDADPATKTTDAIVLAATDVVEDVDVGVTLAAGSASLGDLVWLDSDFGHTQSQGEPGIADVPVELLDADRVLLATEATDANGFYSFGGLPLGDYILRFVPPAGYEVVLADQGGDDSLDSDIDANLEAAVSITVPGATDLDVDAGFRIDCFDVIPVAFGSEWRWSTTFYAGWEQTGYVEPPGAWTEEQATLGYGLTVESTISDTSTTVVYARLAFEVEDPTIYDDLDLSLFRNDGAVVYLNGTEVLRSNVPVSGSGSDTVSGTALGSLLVEGTNVLAVEAHRTASPASLAFDVELSAEICRPCVGREVIVADRVTYIRDGSGRNRGGETLAKMDASTEENALFAWPVAVLPTDAEVLHAAVTWEVRDDSSDTFHFYPLEIAWDELAADWFEAAPSTSWNTAGANDDELDYDGSEPLASFRFADDPPPGQDSYRGLIVLNVSGRELVQAWARGEHAVNGILAPGEGGGNKLEVDSDDGAHPPELEVVYRSCGN
ncbi:MAG: hypothetical protein MI919_11960, partial [Holophagales bacterium]|nr:hypothetical protein [Holophagales bacterium]